MTAILPAGSAKTNCPTGEGSSRAAMAAELTKCKKELASWENCASGKSETGKAKIAEIARKIATIEAKAKRMEDAKPLASLSQAKVQQGTVREVVRLDGLGAYLNVHA